MPRITVVLCAVMTVGVCDGHLGRDFRGGTGALGIPLRSLRSASPFASRKGTFGFPLRGNDGRRFALRSLRAGVLAEVRVGFVCGVSGHFSWC